MRKKDQSTLEPCLRGECKPQGHLCRHQAIQICKLTKVIRRNLSQIWRAPHSCRFTWSQNTLTSQKCCSQRTRRISDLNGWISSRLWDWLTRFTPIDLVKSQLKRHKCRLLKQLSIHSTKSLTTSRPKSTSKPLTCSLRLSNTRKTVLTLKCSATSSLN